jgi:hypothetical protein
MQTSFALRDQKSRAALLSDIVKKRSIRTPHVVMSHAAANIQALFNRTLSGRSRNKLVFLSVPNSSEVRVTKIHAY